MRPSVLVSLPSLRFSLDPAFLAELSAGIGLERRLAGVTLKERFGMIPFAIFSGTAERAHL
jgi:hypothetical protein